MKKLHEIVAELEAELATCTPEDYPRVCVELCRHLAYVDSIRSVGLLAGLLQERNSDLTVEQQIVALCLSAQCVMYQLDAPQAVQFATRAWHLAEPQALNDLKVLVQLELGYAYLYSNRLKEAIDIAEWAHEQCSSSLNNEELLFKSKMLLINVHNENDHARAGQIAFEALALAKETGKGWLIGLANFMLGYWARHVANRTKAAYDFFEEAKYWFVDQGAKEHIISVSITLVRSNANPNDLPQTLAIELEMLKLAQELKNPRQTIVALYEIGATYAKMGNIALAEQYFIKAINLGKQHRNAFETATAASQLGRLYENTERNEEAIQWFVYANDCYTNTLNMVARMTMSNHLHKIYARIGEHDKAYEHLLNYIDIKLKRQDEARIKETTKLQQLYEKEKRETELQELTIKQQQTELEQAESELKAIRAQMNPHFIFNALNTIQSYIYLNDKQNASNYLGKFSRLTRMVLDMSNTELVSLKDELEAITLYLQLERMRFEEVLVFNIEVDSALDTESIKLPAMLIQPYLENAIKHGLLHKKDNRELYCGFELIGNNLVVSIDDNGIGRQRSGELNAAKMDNHQSFATQANSKRFNLLNKNGDENVGAAYTDKVDAQGQPVGTLVVLTIPVQFDGALVS